jgi:hypothetical protein
VSHTWGTGVGNAVGGLLWTSALRKQQSDTTGRGVRKPLASWQGVIEVNSVYEPEGNIRSTYTHIQWHPCLCATPNYAYQGPYRVQGCQRDCVMAFVRSSPVCLIVGRPLYVFLHVPSVCLSAVCLPAYSCLPAGTACLYRPACLAPYLNRSVSCSASAVTICSFLSNRSCSSCLANHRLTDRPTHLSKLPTDQPTAYLA